MSYVLPTAALGYDAGVELRDVTLAEARSWACNRCGDCCDGSREHVRKDEATGLPLFVWESPERAADPARSQTADPRRYAGRFDGEPLLQPIVMRDGGIDVGTEFDRDIDGRPHASFRCRALLDPGAAAPDDGGVDAVESACAIYRPPATLGTDVRGLRPASCGAFPVFGTIVDDAIIGSGYFVPPTGALPRCTWHGIRVTGPWKRSPTWVERFRRQVDGGPDAELDAELEALPALPTGVAAALLGRAGRDV